MSYLDSRWFKISLILSLLFFVLFILYFSAYGFDLEDEGYYYLGYYKAQYLSFNLSGFHSIIRLLPFSDHVVFNRLERLLLHILVSVFFAYSLSKNVFNEFKIIIVFGWILLGNFMSYAYSPPSMSYNTINLFLIQILASINLFYLKSKFDNKFYKASMFILIVFLFSLLVFNKVTSSIIFAVWSVGLASFLTKNFNLKFIFQNSLVYILGFILAIFWFVFSFDFPIDKFLSYLFSSYDYDVYPKHDFWFHFKQLFVNPIYEGKFLFVFLLVLILLHLIRSKIILKKQSLMIYNILVLQVLIMSACYYMNHYYFGFGSEFYLIIIFFISFANIKYIFNSSYDKKIIVLYLLFMPVVGFCGSDVSPFEGYNHYAVFYFVVLILISQNMNLFYLKLLPIFFFLILITRYVYYPFGISRLTSQTKEFSIKNNSKIFIQNKSYNEVLELDSLLNSYFINENTIYVNLPSGLIFLTGRSNLFNPYYNNSLSFSSYLNVLKFKKLPSEFNIVRKYGLRDVKYRIYCKFVNSLISYDKELVYKGKKYEIIKFRIRK